MCAAPRRLISQDTFEEKLNQIMQEKQRLSDITVEAGAMFFLERANLHWER